MSRALIVLQSDADREKACRWAMGVPFGSRIEFKETKRSLPQNDRFWAMLTDIAAHMKAQGRDHTPEQWKVIFMAAYGHEVKFLPTLDQKSFIPLGHSSSDLSVKEMTDLIEFMLAWGAEAGVAFKDPKEADTNSGSPPPEADDAPSTSSAEPEVPSPASGSPLSDVQWLQTAARMLWAATNVGGDTDANLSVLNNQRLAVGELCFPDTEQAVKDKAGSIYRQCKSAVLSEIGKPEALKIIAGIAGMTPADIGGEANG